MRKLRYLAALGALGCGVGLVFGTTVEPVEPTKGVVLPLGTQSFPFAFEANQRAAAILIGYGPPGEKSVPLAQHTMLGMYVLDEFGNCVARDDIVNAKVRDDLGTEWYPTATGRYTIEVVNFGNQPNAFDLAVK